MLSPTTPPHWKLFCLFLGTCKIFSWFLNVIMLSSNVTHHVSKESSIFRLCSVTMDASLAWGLLSSYISWKLSTILKTNLKSEDTSKPVHFLFHLSFVFSYFFVLHPELFLRVNVPLLLHQNHCLANLFRNLFSYWPYLLFSIVCKCHSFPQF